MEGPSPAADSETGLLVLLEASITTELPKRRMKMKLRYTALLGALAGIAALVAFPTTGQVFQPAPVESVAIFANDGTSAITLIDGLPNTAGMAADEDCEEGIMHWANGPMECKIEKYKLYGPRARCSKMQIGGRLYHVLKYYPERNHFDVTPCADGTMEGA